MPPATSEFSRLEQQLLGYGVPVVVAFLLTIVAVFSQYSLSADKFEQPDQQDQEVNSFLNDPINLKPEIPVMPAAAAPAPQAEDLKAAETQATDFTYNADPAGSEAWISGYSEQGKAKFAIGAETAPADALAVINFPSSYTDVNGKTWQIVGIDIAAGEFSQEMVIGAWPEHLVTLARLDTTSFAQPLNLGSIPNAWPDSLTTIGDRALTCKSTGVLRLPTSWNQVTYIGDEAFSRCGLATLPRSWGEVRFIGRSAFSRTGVVNLPDNWGKLTVIPPGAFAHNFTIQAIPKSWGNVVAIGDGAFFMDGVATIPTDWGKVSRVGRTVFAWNRIPQAARIGGTKQLYYSDASVDLSLANEETLGIYYANPN